MLERLVAPVETCAKTKWFLDALILLYLNTRFRYGNLQVQVCLDTLDLHKPDSL